nr:hypothetical protein [Tanacetum cinerariifolium]
MRIEQYFLMTDYSLWEVILNGDSPAPIRVIEGVLQPVSPTTAEQRLARKNKLKACGTLLMALPDKHQLKFDTHKDAKTLMEAIKKSTNKPVSAAANVSTVSAKIPVSALPNVDSLSNAMIYSFFASQYNSPQLDNDDLKQIDSDDLKEMDLKWKMAMLTVRARRFLQRTKRNLRENRPTSMGFDMSKVECYNYHRKGHFAKECRSPKDTRRNGAAEPQRRNVPVGTSTSNALVSQCDGVGSYDWSFQAEVKPTNYALMAFSSSSSSSDNEFRDNALVSLRQNLEKAEQDRDDLKLKLENFQTSSKNLSELLASQTNAKTGLGYNSQVFTRVMFDCDDYLSSGSDKSLPPSLIYDRYQSGNGNHVVPPPYTGTFMPPKPDLVFNNSSNDVETDHPAFTVKLSPTKPENDLSYTHRPSASIIPIKQVQTPRLSVHNVETSIPSANSKTVIPKPTSNGNRGNRKACCVYKSLDHLIKDCDYHEKKMAQPTARNHAQRENYKDCARMSLPNPHRHVVLAPILTQSKLVPITIVRPVTTAVLKTSVTRPRQAKTIVTKTNSPPIRLINSSPSPKASTFPPKVTTIKATMGDPQHALKDKEVIDSGFSRYMIGNMSYLSDFEELNGRYVSFGGNPKGGKIFGKERNAHVEDIVESETAIAQTSDSINPQNTDGDAAFDEKEPEFEGRKPESEVNVSPSSSAQSKKHDDKTKSEAKGKNTSQLPDDPNMPKFEDITYTDDEDDVGAETNFNNLETSITVNPIPTTRVHKDHPMTQIIGDLSSATQTKSMTRVAIDQGGLSQINNDDFHTCMFACFLSQEEPKRVHQALKDLCWIKAMQEELLQFKMQKVWVLVDLPHGKRAIVKQKKDGIFISQDKYVAKISRKFGLTYGKSASTPIDTKKPLLKDPDGEDVDVHTYRSMIGSLMYLTSSRPNIMFAVCQCKKQTIMATSSTETEYVAAASCCAQVLWIQNQLLDYG